MSQGINSALVSLGVAFLCVTLVLAAEATTAKLNFHFFAIIATTILWLLYTLVLWGCFFKDVPTGKSLLSIRFLESSALGLAVTIAILASMLLLGKTGVSHPLALAGINNVNFSGVMLIWIFIAGLLFDGMFNPHK